MKGSFELKKPLVLSPAGSFESLVSAIDAGADEIYFGLSSHNARINAKNFTKSEAKEALKLCRLYGVKTDITLNTLITDREMKEACEIAYFAACEGADAFIIQDIGLAKTLKKAVPGIVLHASTQCTCHSTAGAEMLKDAGFDRVVLARELDRESIKNIVKTGIETEIFVHGALCVCHSGDCLMSSVIGKRSGNRGLCAQPCRLPYGIESESADASKKGYPLSLKDMSLANHIKEISQLGVTALKIEGRMKPGEYVRGTTEIYKKLVTENRNATEAEITRLENLFSRSGFTDGYFTGKYLENNKEMYGIRTDADKEKTKNEGIEKSVKTKRKIDVFASFCENKPPFLKLTLNAENNKTYTSCVKGENPLESAQNAPLTAEELKKSLLKFGNTPFECENFTLELKGSVFAPKAVINSLRRAAVRALEKEILSEIKEYSFDGAALELFAEKPQKESKAKCRYFANTAENALKIIKNEPFSEKYETESVCIPLLSLDDGKITEIMSLSREKDIPLGVRMPKILFDNETEKAKDLLKKAEKLGIKYAVCENIGQIPLVKKAGLGFCAGQFLNVFNSYTADFFKKEGAKSVTLSPELLDAQMRDIKTDADKAVAASGRLELMTLESCVMRANGRCKNKKSGEICAYLSDRMNVRFPVRADMRLCGTGYPCRNTVLNSVSLKLIEKPDALKKAGADIIIAYEE